MAKLTKDMENKIPTAQAEIYTVINLIKSLPEVKKYENCVTKSKKSTILAARKTLSPDFIKHIEKDILGIKY